MSGALLRYAKNPAALLGLVLLIAVIAMAFLAPILFPKDPLSLAGRPLPAAAKAHRQTCACYASRDIGSYDSCPHGCAYCYAVSGRDAAKRRFAAHDPAAEYLVQPNAASRCHEAPG